MFDGGVPEHLRRFIASPPPPPLSPPPPPQPPPAVAVARALPFPLSFPSFEPTHHFLSSVLGNNNNHKIIHHHHHHHHDDIKDGGISGWMGPTDHDDIDDDDDHHHPWSSDEVLALLRLRSTVENWFPGFTWEHISRKLTEVGFKRTPQECKEKFEEEERRYFNSNNDHINDYNNNNNKGNFRMFSELEEFYHHGHGRHHGRHDDDQHASPEVVHSQNKGQKSLEEPRSAQENDKMGQDLEKHPREEEEEEELGISPSDEGKGGNMENDTKSSSSSAMMMMMMMRDEKKKRKRKREREGFEMLKGFCEGLVRNMIAQQEEMHKKILEDMVKRDEEKIAREEAWKKQETERINKELEIRAHEQALASDRNSTIIKFISKFTSLNEDHHRDHHHHQQKQHGNKVQSPSTSQTSSSLVLPQTPSSSIPTLSSSQTLTSQNPLFLHTNEKSREPISVQTLKTKTHNPKPPKSDEKCDLGKRWPKDEVLALVNIRCSISAKNGDHHHEDQHHKDGSTSSSSKALPLWERISKKMMDLGYKRSAKRCKEKWENINKYFRKTKDVNKKRPLDSRTCPYFHQLSALYSQASLVGTVVNAGKGDSGGQDPESRPEETRVGSLNDGPGDDPNMHVAATGHDEDEKNDTVQASGFDFEF